MSQRLHAFRGREKFQAERKYMCWKILAVDNSRPEFARGRLDQHARIRLPRLIGYGAHTVSTYVLR